MTQKKTLIVDLHIKSLAPEGHFFERAATLATEIHKRSGRRPSLCCALETEPTYQGYFEAIISTPGFNSFGFPVLAGSGNQTASRLIWLDLTREFLSSSTATKTISRNTLKQIDTADPRIIQEFYTTNKTTELEDYFRGHLDRMYCALPEETIDICQFISKQYRSNLPVCPERLSGKRLHRSFEAVYDLLTRDKREQSALQRMSAARIAALAIKSGFTSIVFTTASIQDAIGALALRLDKPSDTRNDKRNTTAISFVFHQPTEFDNRDLCYQLYRLYNDCKSGLLGDTEVYFFASCEEMKDHLTNPKYCNIGSFFKVLCGPFPSKTTRITEIQYNDDIKRSLRCPLLAQQALAANSSWNAATYRELKSKTEHIIPQEFTPHPSPLQQNRTSKTSLVRAQIRSASSNDYFLTFLGDIRDEKEFPAFLSLKTILSQSEENKVRLVRPTFFSAGGIEKSKSALDDYTSRNLDYGDVTYDLLSESDYFWLMKNSSCVYAGYASDCYSVKQSGIFYECLVNASPMILNIGTSSSHALGRLAYEALDRVKKSNRVSQRIAATSAETTPKSEVLVASDIAASAGISVAIRMGPLWGRGEASIGDIHAFFMISVSIDSQTHESNKESLIKFLETRGRDVACVFADIELRQRFGEISEISTPFRIEAKPIVGITDEQWAPRVDLIDQGAKQFVDFFARHAILDIREESLSSSFLKNYRESWWQRDQRSEGAFDMVTECVRSIIEIDFDSVAGE